MKMSHQNYTSIPDNAQRICQIIFVVTISQNICQKSYEKATLWDGYGGVYTHGHQLLVKFFNPVGGNQI